MSYQKEISDATGEAAKEAFRYAAAVPADKVDWKPSDDARSVIEIARELAKCPEWAYNLVAGKPWPENREEHSAQEQAEMNAWTSVAQCQEVCEKNLGQLTELYSTVSDERLKETVWLPFNGGRDHTIREIMDYPRWNFNWHSGQLAYIQTLYGDKGMY